MEDVPDSVINAHVAFDKLIGALASISLMGPEDLDAFKELMEKKIPDVVSKDDFIESQTLYFVLKNVHKSLQGIKDS